MSSGTESGAAVAHDSSLDATPSSRGGSRGRWRGSGRSGRGGGGRNHEGQAPGGENNGGKSRGPRGGRGGGGGQDRRQRPDGGAATNGDTALSGHGQQRQSWGEQTPKELGGLPKPDADDAASDLDSSICFICANPVKYSSIAPCNHVTCHICAIRMRALYKNKTCAHCRTESEWVVFSKDESKRFEEFQESELVAKNDALGVKFEDQSIYDDTTLLLRYNCPDANCDRACRGWPDLHYHVRTVHNKILCDLCSRNKKVFTHEHTLFTPQELRKHERTGDDQPGSENQSGFKGHPECGFCRERFFSSDELYVHCRDKHEKCFLCDRRNPGAQQDYYINYEALVAHFGEDHFMCGEPDCLEKKFVVFDSEMDLKAHQLEVHPNSLSKGALRDARRVELRSLEDRRPQNQHGGRRGAARMRLEPEEQIPRTEQQMSRAELAYHRTLAVQSAQSTTTRMFGGQLTDPTPAPGPTPQNAPGAGQPFANGPTPPPPRPTVQAATRPAQMLNTSGTATPPRPPPRPADASANQAAFPPLAAPRTAQAEPLNADGSVPEESRRVKHAAVLERAGGMLRNNETKLTTFKSHVSSYQKGRVTAAGLVDLFWSLFDVHAPDLGKLIKELADLFDDEQKKQDLLKAWNSWKAINEDYPPFAGASSSALNTSTNTSRLLKLKSSTSPSARSTTARQGAWGAAAAPPQPSIRISKNRPVPGAAPWVSSKPSATPSSSPALSFHTTAAPPPPARRAVASTVDFPSLPVKPPPPPGWGPIKRKEHGAPPPSGNPWGGQGEGSADPSDAEANPNHDGGAGKKKKGKQKQLLFHVGL